MLADATWPGQHSGTGFQLPIPGDAQVFYIRQHSSTRTCYSTATAPSCQQEDVLAQERFEIAEKTHLGEYYNDWLNLCMVRSRLPSGLCPAALLLLYTYKKNNNLFTLHTKQKCCVFISRWTKKVFPPHSNPMLCLWQKTKQPRSRWGWHTACGLGAPLTVMFP